MKKTALNAILSLIISLLIISTTSINARAQGDPPTPQELFNGHSFTESNRS